MEFKDRIKELRKEKGLSATQLATEFGKADSSVRTWETGKSKPDADTLVNIAEYFNCSVDYLLGKSNFRNQSDLDMLNNDILAFSDALYKLPTGMQGLYLAVITNILKIVPPEEGGATLRKTSFHLLLSLLGSLGYSQSNMADVYAAKKQGPISENMKFDHFVAQYTNKEMARNALEEYITCVGEMDKYLLDINSQEEYALYMEQLREAFKPHEDFDLEF